MFSLECLVMQQDCDILTATFHNLLINSAETIGGLFL